MAILLDKDDTYAVLKKANTCQVCFEEFTRVGLLQSTHMACGIPDHQICKGCWLNLRKNKRHRDATACLHCVARNTGRYSHVHTHNEVQAYEDYADNFRRKNRHKRAAKR